MPEKQKIKKKVVNKENLNKEIDENIFKRLKIFSFLDSSYVLKEISKLLDLTYFDYNDTITLSCDSFVIDITENKIKLHFMHEKFNAHYFYVNKYLQHAFDRKDFVLFYNFIRNLLFEKTCEKRELKFLETNMFYCTCIDKIDRKMKLRKYSENYLENIFTHLSFDDKIMRFEEGSVLKGKNFIIKENKFFINKKEREDISIFVKKGFKTDNIINFFKLK